MRIEKLDGRRERKILAAMITDPIVLGRIAAKWEDDLFSAPWSNLVAGWCVDYFRQYKEPPKRAIENLHAAWAEKRRDRETAQLVAKFLESVSDEHEREEAVNAEHVLDLAGKHFNHVRASKVIDAAQGELDSGNADGAWGVLTAGRQVDVGVGAVSKVFDEAELDAVWKEEEPPVVEYPGALGWFFKGQLTADAFVAFQGPEKSGKTWWLIDLAWRAMLQRKRVAFFEVGDMSDRQIRKRLLSRCARHPFQSTNPDRSWPCEVKIPASIRKPRKGEQVATVTWKRKTFDAPLSKKVAAEKIAELMKVKLKSQRPFFRLSVHPTISISVDGIRSALRSWEVQEDWVPEVVVIDYADILAPIDARMDKRDQINHTWAALRAMSQELHCLVATATQADSDSYGRVTMSRSNFSEDHRKLAHVTGIVGINVTEEEKKKGISRLNWIVLREGEYVSGRCVHVAGCLPLANPAVASDF